MISCMSDLPSQESQESQPAPGAAEVSLESTLLAVARGLRRGWASAIGHTGLSPHQARALRLILSDGPIRPGMLAERLRVTPRSVTEVVDALVERALVERRPDPDDRRAMIVSISAAGRRLADEIAAIRRAHTRTVFDSVLNREEQHTLDALLGRLAAHLWP